LELGVWGLVLRCAPYSTENSEEPKLTNECPSGMDCSSVSISMVSAPCRKPLEWFNLLYHTLAPLKQGVNVKMCSRNSSGL
jgi:hypothetical protein